MSKALGIVIKTAPKKTRAVKKKAADSSSEDDEAGRSPAKKRKLEVDGGDVQDGVDEC
jgi:hypothetical protein